MLVRACDNCDENIKKDERYYYINNIDKIYQSVSVKDSINGADICIDCARKYTLSQIFDKIFNDQND